MRLFTRTLLQGLHDGLVEHGGMPPFPNDKIASAIFDEIATDAGLPPYLERRLDKTAAVTLSRAIAAYSEKLAGAGMAAPPERVALVKQASQRDLGERAMIVASYYMQKAADEGSLVPSGPNTLAAAAAHDQIAAVDQTNRPEGRYGVPIGTTDMPVPGMIGREMAAPGAPTVGATYKGADIVDPARLEAMKDWFARRGNEVSSAVHNIPDWFARRGNEISSAVHNIPGQAREAARYLDPRSAVAGLKDTVPQVRDATSWLQNDPSTLANLGHTHDTMRALRKEKAMEALHHLGRLGALGGLTAAAGAGVYTGYRALTNQEGHESTASVKEALEPMSPEMIQEINSLPPEYLTEMKRIRQWRRAQAALANAPKLPDPSQNRDPVSSVVNAAFKRTEAPVAHPIPDHLRNLATEAPGPTTLRGLGRTVMDELSSSPLSHMRNFEHRSLGGKLRSVGAVGTQILGPAAAAYSIYHGGRALYDHFNEEKEKAAADADDEAALAPILEACQEAGVHPTPELVAMLHQAMEGHAASGGAPGGPTPSAAPGGAPDGFNADDGEKQARAQAAHWDAVLKAAGEGSLTPSAPNTLAAAAQHDQIAAVDKKNRPEGKYKVPVGQTQLSTAAGEIGAEKKAAEAAYWANIKQAAAEWGAYLPAAMPLEQKRQAIAKVASLAPEQREQFVRALHG